MSSGEIRALFFVTREALIVADKAGEEGQQQREYESHAKSLRQDLQDLQDESCGSCKHPVESCQRLTSPAAFTSCFTPATITNSSAPYGFAASSTLTRLCSRQSLGGGMPSFKYESASNPVPPSCERVCASGLISFSAGERSIIGLSDAPAVCQSASIWLNSARYSW